MIVTGSIFSQTLQMNTGLSVMAPDELLPSESYQAVYLLHGLSGSCTDYLNYTMLADYGKNCRAIYIMPEVQRSFYTDMVHGYRYFTYITEELPAICKNIFRISLKREDTAIIGLSMGGYGALKCALSRPEQYGFCGAISSAFLYIREILDEQRGADVPDVPGIPDLGLVFGESLEYKPEYDITELAKRIEGEKVKPVIRAYCGTSDFLYEDNDRFQREMKGMDFDFAYEEWKGIHDWNFFNPALKKALEEMSACRGKDWENREETV